MAQREKIKLSQLKTGEAITLSIDNEPEEVQGQYGTEYQYIFGGHKIAWLNGAQHAAVLEARCGQNDTVTIQRTGKATWRAYKQMEEPEDAQIVAPPIDPRTSRTRYAEPPANEPEPLPARRMNGFERAPEQRQPPQRAEAPRQQLPHSQNGFSDETIEKARRAYAHTPLLAALITAIDTVSAAESHSKAIGYPVTFEAEQIQKFAITLYLEASRNTSTSARYAA